jgi:hypothetical protein
MPLNNMEENGEICLSWFDYINSTSLFFYNRLRLQVIISAKSYEIKILSRMHV